MTTEPSPLRPATPAAGLPAASMNPAPALNPTDPAKRRAATLAGARQPTIRRTFVLKNRRGLHCRPAALLVRTLGNFHSQATVEANGVEANPRSIFDLMCLTAVYGTKLTFVLTGGDAQEALGAVQHLFETNFADAYREDESLAAGASPQDFSKP